MNRVERTRDYVNNEDVDTHDKVEGSFEEIMKSAVNIKQSMVKKRRVQWERAPEFFKHTMTSVVKNDVDGARAQFFGLDVQNDAGIPFYQRCVQGGRRPRVPVATAIHGAHALLAESERLRAGASAFFMSGDYCRAVDHYVHCLSLFLWFEKPENGQEEIHLREIKALVRDAPRTEVDATTMSATQVPHDSEGDHTDACIVSIDKEVSLLFLNIAACLLKLGSSRGEDIDDARDEDGGSDLPPPFFAVSGDELKGAMFACNEALDILGSSSDSNLDDSAQISSADATASVLVSKAYYRRAQCRIEIGSAADLEIAIRDLRMALRRAPPSHAPSIRALLNRTMSTLKQRNDTDRGHFGGMFERGGGMYSDMSPSTVQQSEEEEQERRRRAFVYDPTLPLSYEAQKKAVVVDNHNLNNAKVREHIIKLFEEQKRDRMAREKAAQSFGGGGRESNTSSGSRDSDRKQNHHGGQKLGISRGGGGEEEGTLRSLWDTPRLMGNLFDIMYKHKYRRAVFVLLGAFVALAWRQFVMV